MPPEPSSPTNVIAITGASGLLGSALSTALRARGDHVVHLVRRDPAADLPDGVREVRWDIDSGLADGDVLDEVTAAVNLAGANLGTRRWNDRYKAELVRSRVGTTRLLSRILADLPQRPRLVSGSAIGIYGDRKDTQLTEESAPGTGFIADLASDWERATWIAEEAGVSVAHARTGIVLSRSGGALARLMPLVRAGLAGPLGSGRQYWSWISLPDHVAAMMWLIDHPEISGPVNLTAPNPAPQTEVVKALASQVHRPAVIPAPTLALRLALGEMASEILGSQRVAPSVLLEHGFEFTHPELADAAAWVARADTDTSESA